ncbi:MAG: MFS transporter [Chromatiales bacterium]|nr:MFS transporter [Chromatiales bacterium]
MSATPETPPASPAGSALAPLRRPVFRALWLALVVSSLGSWMHDVGAAWLMTTLAPEPVMVALVQAAALLPLFLLTLPAGALADLLDRRRYLIAIQIWLIVVAGSLGIMTLVGITSAWLLLLLTFAMGCGVALMMPAFSALIPDLVPREELMAAVTLNSMAFNATRALGPAIAGGIVALAGPGIVFVINALSFLAVVWVLWMWRSQQPASNLPAERFSAAMRTGLRYVRQSAALRVILLRGVALFVSMSAPLAFLPLVVRTELAADADTYGLLLGCVGAGAVLAGTQLARVRRSMSSDTLLLLGTLGVVLASLALAWVRNLPLLALAMLLLGASWISAQSTLQVITQLSLPAWVRARGLAVFIATFMGVMALGAPAWGWLASFTSIQFALTAAAVTGTLGVALTRHLHLERFAHSDPTPAEPLPEPRLPTPVPGDRGPVLVNIEYRIDPDDIEGFMATMQQVRRIRLRNGSMAWGVFQDSRDAGRFVETFLDESWNSHLRQHYRVTRDDRRVIDMAVAYHRGSEPPRIWHLLAPERA